MARPGVLFVAIAVLALTAFVLLCRPTSEGLRFPRFGSPRNGRRAVAGARRYSPQGSPFFRGLRDEHRVSALGPTGAYAGTIDTATGDYVAPHPPVSPAGIFRNAKMMTCAPSPDCAYGVDDGKACAVSHVDALSAPLPPFAVTECHAEGRCYRGSCCNFDAAPLVV